MEERQEPTRQPNQITPSFDSPKKETTLLLPSPPPSITSNEKEESKRCITPPTKTQTLHPNRYAPPPTTKSTLTHAQTDPNVFTLPPCNLSELSSADSDTEKWQVATSGKGKRREIENQSNK